MKLKAIKIAALVTILSPAIALAQTQPATPNSTVTPSAPNSTVQPSTTTPAPNSSIPSTPNSTVNPGAPNGATGISPATSPSNPTINSGVQPSTTPSNQYQSTQPANSTLPAPATQPNRDYNLTQPGTSTNTTGSGTQPNPTYQQSENPQTNSMLRVESDQLPETMRRTLNDPMYSGWENSTIYYNRENDEYSMDLGTGNNAKSYRFDSQGNPVQQSTTGGDDQ